MKSNAENMKNGDAEESENINPVIIENQIAINRRG
jgi:hypothetical protein